MPKYTFNCWKYITPGDERISHGKLVILFLSCSDLCCVCLASDSKLPGSLPVGLISSEKMRINTKLKDLYLPQ